MPFTSATTQELGNYAKSVNFALELRTNFPASSSWQQYPFEDFTLSHEARSPALLRVQMINTLLQFSAEVDQSNRMQLFAEVRLSCTVGAESEVLFQGRVHRLEPRDYDFVLLAQDWLALVNDCECEIDLSPDESAEISPARPLALVQGGAFGSVYGFTYGGAGDPGFNEDSDPGTRRRSWAPGNIRLWYDSSANEEVPPLHYLINLTSGTATILEDTDGKDYWVSGVRCYLEGSLDWAAVYESALTYPTMLGGIGATNDVLDLPETGLDLAGPVYFQGRVSELLRQIGRRQQDNLRLWYDSRVGKYKLRVVTQQAAGNENWVLQHAQSIAQPREIRELYTRVVISGLAERPRNALTENTTTISDISTQGEWFSWDGLNVGADADFIVVGPFIWDGDSNRGASLHNLAGSEGGGSHQYDSWYNFISIDLGSEVRVSRVRLVTPGSRNSNAQAGHQGMFWPGLQLLGSQNNSEFRLLSAQLCGRYPPHTLIEATGKDILSPKLRYIKVLLGAYKHGFDNEDDPSIGLAELELYTTEEYRVVKEIDGAQSPASYYSYSADYDRDGSVDQWQRNHPGLWSRLGQRHRTLCEDQHGNLNELLSHDRAIDLLAESVRLFQQANFLAVCDPRIQLYQTVSVIDELNGNPGSLLVERIVLRPAGTEISGSNYHATALGP